MFIELYLDAFGGNWPMTSSCKYMYQLSGTKRSAENTSTPFQESDTMDNN